MSRTIITQPGQCLEDIALQEYGSIDGVTALVKDNQDVFVNGYSTDLQAGTVLTITGDPLDVPTYNAMRSLNVTPATDSEPGTTPMQGDFNNDFSDDFNL